MVGDKLVVGGLADLVGGDALARLEGFVALVEADIKLNTHKTLRLK